jgi:hypothetical protein
MGQKVRVAIALVILTDRPELWNSKEEVAVSLVNRQNDIEAIRIHRFGVPVSGTENEKVRIEFEEGEKSDAKETEEIGSGDGD